MTAEQQEFEPLGPTLSEQLTRNFYRWEKRGRGWQFWYDVVDLEPVYEPFFHRCGPVNTVVDDGRKPTILSSVVEGIKNRLAGKTESEQVYDPSLFEEEPEPPIFDDSSTLCESTVSLSLSQKVSLDYAEEFLLNMTSCSLPLSFEIIGTTQSSSVQFVCREPDSVQVKQQLNAYFPDAVVYKEGQTLESLWDNDKHTVVVDFGLSEEFMRPLRTFGKLDPDSLTGIIGALEDLDSDELGILQILFQPARQPWSESILKSVTDWQGKSFFADGPEMLHLAKEKVQRPLFAAAIRVAGQSPSSNRAWEIARALAGGLSQLSNPQSNKLIPLSNDGYEDYLHAGDVYYRQSRRSGMLLNSQELVSLVHPPSVSVRAPKLRRELKKTKAAPSIATGHRFVLGENVHQSQKTSVTLSDEQRLRHMHIVGATGTGKSTLLLKLIVQDIENGLGVGVLDPHGDLIDKIIGYIPEKRFEDVVLLDPSDSDYPIGLNILSAHSEQEKTVLASDLVGVFRRLSTSWGDQMNSILANTILAFLESTEGGTLIDLRRFLVEQEYRRRFLQTVRDADVVYYWQKVFSQLSSRHQAPILTRLDTFLRPKPIRYMVAQKEGLNFQDILNNRKIFLAKLAHGLIGMENAYLLGTIIASKFHQAAMARQVKAVSEREGFYLYIDEFQNFVTESMTEILSGARKYGFGLILAHQELRQLFARNSELANSVISNPGTRVCFRLGDFDAKKLEDGFSGFDAQDLQNLGVGEAIVRIERADYDFNLKTTPPADVPVELARSRRERLVDLSRKKYARSRKEIEELLVEEKKPVGSIRPAVAESKQPVSSERPAKKSASEKAGLSTEEKSFLKFICQHSGMFVTKIYKALGLSGYKGDRLKAGLIEKDLIEQEETRKGSKGRLAKALALTEKGAKAVKKVALKGKGGDLHKELQEVVAEQAEVFGWAATIEKKIPRSLESVDVDLKKEDLKVAVEISETTKQQHEIQNIKKCLEAGYDYVLAVCSDDKDFSQLKTEVKKSFTFQERERIRFYHVSRVKDFFSSISPSIVSENAIVSGQITKQKQIMNSEEAAAFLGISINTLYEWIAQRKIPHIKVGRLLKFKRGDLEKWLEKRMQKEERFDILDGQ
jgi:excisionase family DNA binding protein